MTTGVSVGVLGGMIGLGVAKFCLPLPSGISGFVALQVVVMNYVAAAAGVRSRCQVNVRLSVLGRLLTTKQPHREEEPEGCMQLA
jgi:hypothetical protein